MEILVSDMSKILIRDQSAQKRDHSHRNEKKSFLLK